MTQAKKPVPKVSIMFSMAWRSDVHAVITLCSVAGMLAPTGRPSFRANCTEASEHGENLLDGHGDNRSAPKGSTWMQWQSTRELQHVQEHSVFVSEQGMSSFSEVHRRRAGACLGVVGGRHGVGAVEVEQVRDAAKHRLLCARAPAAAEVVQPAACVGNLCLKLKVRSGQSVGRLGADKAL